MVSVRRERDIAAGRVTCRRSEAGVAMAHKQPRTARTRAVLKAQGEKQLLHDDVGLRVISRRARVKVAFGTGREGYQRADGETVIWLGMSSPPALANRRTGAPPQWARCGQVSRSVDGVHCSHRSC